MSDTETITFAPLTAGQLLAELIGIRAGIQSESMRLEDNGVDTSLESVMDLMDDLIDGIRADGLAESAGAGR